jgi:hypothetical protein
MMIRHRKIPIADADWQAMYKRLLDAGHGSRIHTPDRPYLVVNDGDAVEPVWVRLTWERACEMVEGKR